MSEISFSTPALPQTGFSRRWALWVVLKQEILYLCWAAMEIALLAPIVIFVMDWTRFWSKTDLTVWLLLLILLPFNLGRLLSALQISKRDQIRIIILAMIGSSFLTWRLLLFPSYSILETGWLGQIFTNFAESGSQIWSRMLTLFMLLSFLWWRGLRLINFKAEIQRVGFLLRLGSLLFIPFSFLPYPQTLGWGIMPFVLLFLISGLTAISLVRAEQVEKDRSGFSASLNPRWVATIFLTSFLIIFISGFFAVFVSGDIAGSIAEWFTPLRTAILFALAVTLSTLFLLSTPLLIVFDALLVLITNILSTIFSNFNERFGFSLPTDLGAFEEFLPAAEEAAETSSFAIPEVASRLFILSLMLLILVLVSLALTRRFRNDVFAPRKSRSPTEGSSLERPSLGQNLLQRLGVFSRWRSAASVRKIYRQMCQVAGSAGYPRLETETPYEYLQSLSKVWPSGHIESRIITDAYVRVRYGEIPETEQELQKIFTAWQKLERSVPAA